jgi:hypothetical protein
VTAPDDVGRYLDALVAAACAVLREELVAAYAAGSVAFGAYRPGRSDVDVALVTRDALDPAAKHALVAALRHEALPCPARGLELVAYRREVAASGTPEPGFEVELNSGPRMAFRATYDPADRPAADGLFWYGLDRSILHQVGVPLVGDVPAVAMFGDLSPDALRRLLVEALTWWLAVPAAAEDAVLGACRSLARVRTGRWLSKPAAAEHLVAAGDPDAALIRACVAARRGGPPPDAAAARAFQQRVRSEVAGA